MEACKINKHAHDDTRSTGFKPYRLVYSGISSGENKNTGYNKIINRTEYVNNMVVSI